MNELKGSLYLARCLITGECYVGQTKRERPEDRINQHLNAKTDSYFHKSIRYHGQENFVFCWLRYKNVPLWLLNDLEQFFIALYKTYESGYNRTRGGNCSIQPSEEILAKRSGDNHYSKTNPQAWERNKTATRVANQKPEVVAKRSGDNHYYKTNIVGKNRNREIVEQAVRNPEAIAKRSGENHYMSKNPEKREKFVEKTIERNNTNNPMKNPEAVEKMKRTKAENRKRKSKESGQIWLFD